MGKQRLRSGFRLAGIRSPDQLDKELFLIRFISLR